MTGRAMYGNFLTWQSGMYSSVSRWTGQVNDCLPETSKVSGNLHHQVSAFERSLLEQAMASHKGSRKDIMAALSIPGKTLCDTLQKYGLDNLVFFALSGLTFADTLL